MATVPTPDTGPSDSPPTQPSVPPTELPPMPDDIDQPAPMVEPMSDAPMQA